MAPDQPPNTSRLQSFTLADWLVDPRACHLSRGDSVVKLRPQLVDLLACLARRAGEIVLKDEILAEVWPGQYIAESGLSRCVAELRQILGDDAQQPRYIETITKRGYRLVAPVVWVAPVEAAETPVKAQQQAAPAAEDAGPGPPVAGTTPARRPRWQGRGGLAAGGVLLLALGIVAVAMLRRAPAKALLTDRDPVLLAFENRTGDAVFDETIPLAVSIQLEQSPYLALLPPARVQDALRMMKRPPDTPITRSTGIEICERVGGRAVIVTSVARLGTQYVIGLEAVGCGSGSVLARRQVTADRKERVLDALQRAAGEIRLAVGESLPSIQRYQAPAIEATTVSLDALRAVRRGDVARDRGQYDEAAALYRQAIAQDAEFATAYLRLGTITLGDERVTALNRAYALREQVTFPERLEIEAAYHRYVSGELPRVIEALELLRQAYPRRPEPRRGLAVDLMNTGRYDGALAEALESVRLEPNGILNLMVLARAHLYVNHVAEARQAAERAAALGGTAAEPHLLLFWCGVASNDDALLARERAWAAEHPESAFSWFESEAVESMNRGRLGEAARLMGEFEAWATTHGVPDWASRARFWTARYEALCGLESPAIRGVEIELRRAPGATSRMQAAGVMVWAGRFDSAERLLDDLERAGRPGPSQPDAILAPVYRAAIAASRGQTDRALELLAPLQPLELGVAYGLEPLLVRARTHYLAGDYSNARAAFEKMLAHSTIESGRDLQPHAQLGLARTLARAGDTAGSRRTYEQFFERWREADPGLPVLLAARREYAALPK